MSGMLLDDLRDSLLLPTEPFGDGYDEIHNMRQESNHERNAQTLLVIDRLREALWSDETAATLVMVVDKALAVASMDATIRREKFVVRAVLAALAGEDQ